MVEVLAHTGDDTGFHHMNTWLGFGPGTGIGMLLFWILIIVGTVWLAKLSGNQPKEKIALDILEERYARGEIDKAEYAEKKNDIS